MSELIIIAGPTASGKSQFAMDLALDTGAEILSCDALQVYEGMDIGTAKASKEERDRVPHHGIDIVSIDKTYDVAQYLKMAVATVLSVQSRGKKVLVVGGSGLYLKSFFAPVIDALQIPQSVSDQVASIQEEGGDSAVMEALLAFDKRAGESIDIQNPRRVYRALERCLASGEPVSVNIQAYHQQSYPFQGFVKELRVLMPDPEVSRRKIADRTKQMISDGLIDEVESLLSKGLAANRTASQAIGYAQTIAYLKHGGRIEDLENAINLATFKFARRQRTWLRNQLPEANQWIPC